MSAYSANGGPLVPQRVVIAVSGASAPETVINDALRPLGFAPVVMVATIVDVTVMLRSKPAHLVVVPVDSAPADLAAFAAELRRHAGVSAIGTAPVKDADKVLSAMRSGITEFLVSPLSPTELAAAASRLLVSAAPVTSLGRVFTVYSAKGGLGTSTVAVSIAWSLAQLNPAASVALVDFTTTGAGVRVMLNVQPLYDLGSIASHPDRIDAEYLRSVMFDHEERVSVLAAAEELDAADPLDSGSAARLIEVLRREYAFIVIDTDHHFADQTIAALDAAHRILLVTHLDISALRSTQRSLGIFARLGYPAERIEVVANRRSERDRISLPDAAKVLGRPIVHRLPNDYEACSSAITSGQFVQRYAASSPFSIAVKQMAGSLCGVATNGNGVRDGSRFSRFFGRR